MATGKIKKPGVVNRITSGIIVPNEGIEIREQYLDIIGNLFVLNLRCFLQTPSTGRVGIGAVISNYAPDYTTRVPCSCATVYDSSLNSYGNAFFLSNGNISVDLYGAQSIQEIDIRFIYIKA